MQISKDKQIIFYIVFFQLSEGMQKYAMIRTNANSSRSQGTTVTEHSILVNSNVAQITEFLNFVSCKIIAYTSQLR